MDHPIIKAATLAQAAADMVLAQADSVPESPPITAEPEPAKRAPAMQQAELAL